MFQNVFAVDLKQSLLICGGISIIYSDNGTNFIGANNLLGQINWNKIFQFSSAKKIKWNFNSPKAAWWGGWWEGIVTLIKELLRRNLGKAFVAIEELHTLLCDRFVDWRMCLDRGFIVMTQDSFLDLD